MLSLNADMGMTRPEKIAGRDPSYTREAREARVQGLLLAKCVVNVRGTLENCRIIRSLPHMNRAVLDALATHVYKPVTYQGKPIAVDYVFHFRFMLTR